jgi:YidC/Oxa1 family membrane protein insertase
VNKNSLLAFVLMVIVVIFFNTSFWNNFWYGTILKREVPVFDPQQRREELHRKTAEAEAARAAQNANETVDELPDAQIGAPTNADAAPADTFSYMRPDGANLYDSAATAIAQNVVVDDTIFVSTNRIIAGVTTRGARIVSIKMKDYTYTVGPRREQLIDLLPGDSTGAQLTINNESFDDKFFTIVSDIGVAANIYDDDGVVVASAPKHVTVGAGGYDLVLETKSSDGRPLQKVFRFADDTYKIGYTVRGQGIAGRKISKGWFGGIAEPESGQDLPFGQIMDRRRAHFSDGLSRRGTEHREMNKRDSVSSGGTFRWVGMSSKYFFIAMVAEELTYMDIDIRGRNTAGPQSREQVIDYSVSYTYEADSDEVNSQIYAGPNGIRELSQFGLKFEKALFPVLSWARHILWAGTWFPPLAELVLLTLHFFYGLVKDYGAAIFLLTLLLKLITFPMTQSSARSMLRIKDLQPKLVKLREKYKGNPQKMNEEMMALYKSEGVNPLNPGCLPMFLQMPIFIALFIVLRKAIELRGESSFLLPWVSDLSQPEALFFLPFTIPMYGNNVALMPIIMAALTFFQQKQTITDPNQKAIIYIMPVVMLVLFNSFPAGVVFYWTVSSALSLAQQKWLPPKVRKPLGVTAAAAGGTTPALAATAQTNTRHKAPMKRKSGGGGKRSKK